MPKLINEDFSPTGFTWATLITIGISLAGLLFNGGVLVGRVNTLESQRIEVLQLVRDMDREGTRGTIYRLQALESQMTRVEAQLERLISRERENYPSRR